MRYPSRYRTALIRRLGPICALACLPVLAACADRASPASALWPDADTAIAAAPSQGPMDPMTMGPVRLFQSDGDPIRITRLENSGDQSVEVVYQLLGGPYQTVRLGPGETVEIGSLSGRLIAVR
jgi:hypothetical protein